MKEMYWDVGGALAHLLATPTNQFNGSSDAAGPSVSSAGGAEMVEDLRSRLSPHEVDFLRSYNDLILDYKSDFLDIPLDLGSSISRPPPPAGELFVDVQVIKECGSVYTEHGGLVEFRLGQRYMVRRSDVERLVVQGFLEEV